MTIEGSEEAHGVAALGEPRAWIRFSWLLRLRWAAALGQLATVAGVAALIGVALPIAGLLAVVAIELATNAGLEIWFRALSPHDIAALRAARAFPRDRGKARQRGALKRTAALGETVLGAVMAFDILLLTTLLYFTGGPANPFSAFYLVNLALAAVLLRGRAPWVLHALALLCFGALFLDHRPLPPLSGANATGPGGGAGSAAIRHLGMFLALGAAQTFIVAFITRVMGELDEREGELERARARKAQSERLASLVTLAAGAAHEIASPLSTIAVAARDLEIGFERGAPPGGAAEDARLIGREVARCRKTLDRMLGAAGEAAGEAAAPLAAGELIDAALDGLAGAERVDVEATEAVRGRTLHLPRFAVAQAVRALLGNALDAAGEAGRVSLLAAAVRAGEGAVREGASAEDPGAAEGTLRLSIVDRGAGMPPGVLARAGEPFFTTKEPGHGMGLGLYLARSVVERVAGRLEIVSAPGKGTAATVILPLAGDP